MNSGYIEQLLTLKKSLSVTDLGTFSITSTSATLGGSHIQPPQRNIEFKDGIWDAADTDLEDYISVRHQHLSREAIRKEIRNFASEVRDQVRRNGYFEIGKMGRLVTGQWGNLEFETSTGFRSSDKFFGLPKLEVLPLQQEVLEGEVFVPLAKKETGILLLIVILIPLILVGIGATYLFFNPDAYIRYKEGRLFEKPTTSQPISTTQPLDTLNQAGDSTGLTGEVKSGVKESEKTNNKPTSTQPKPEATTNQNPPKTSALVVTSPTNRFYVITQAVGTVEQGKKVAAQLRASGYAGAKVISAQNKVRVSLQDYASKVEADMLKNKVAGTYQGAWVLNY